MWMSIRIIWIMWIRVRVILKQVKKIPNNGLVPLTMDKDTTVHSLNATIGNSTIAKYIKFYHVSIFSLILVVLAKAIDTGYLITSTVFTTKQVNKYSPSIVTTHKGHLKAQRQGLRSTKNTVNSLKSITTSLPYQTPVLVEDDSKSLHCKTKGTIFCLNWSDITRILDYLRHMGTKFGKNKYIWELCTSKSSHM